MENFYKFCNVLGNISIGIFGVLWILGKMNIIPYTDNITEIATLFVFLYFFFKFLYYEKYYVKKTNEKIAELSNKIKDLETKERLN